MINFKNQYENLSKIWQSYNNKKKSTKVRITQEDLDYAKIHYNHKRFENYTLENFISVLIFIIFNNRPTSKTDFLQKLNSIKKTELLNAIKFKNMILNYNITKEEDFSIINELQINNYLDVYELYNNGKITIIGLYEYCKNIECKGRLLKKELQIFKILLDFFKLEQTEENKWP